MSSFNVATQGYNYSHGTLVSGTNVVVTPIPGWMPLSLRTKDNHPDGTPATERFFGAATTLSCLFSGQSYLSTDMFKTLSSKVAKNYNDLNSSIISTNSALNAFEDVFKTFKGDILNGLGTAISSLALEEVQTNVLTNAVSQLSQVEGSLFSAIAQQAAKMTNNLTLAYTRNFVDVLLSVYPIFNSAEGADGGVCNVDDFFPEVCYEGFVNAAPVLDEVVEQYVASDAAPAAPNMGTPNMHVIASPNTDVANAQSAPAPVPAAPTTIPPAQPALF